MDVTQDLIYITSRYFYSKLLMTLFSNYTAQKCERKLRIWSHLLKKSLTENFFFCAALMMPIESNIL